MCLKLRLKEICEGVFDIDVLRAGSGLQVFLNYALGDKSEAGAVLKVIQHLQGISKKADVFYIPCYDAYDDSTPTHKQKLKTEEIFSKKYFPSLSTQENFKYLLVPL
jgi:hypothetical protein